MTTDRRVLRPWTLVLVVALLATMLVALRPSGSTMAAWSDEVSVQVPTLQTGSVGMSVAANAVSARIAVTGDAQGSWRPASAIVEGDGRALTGDQLAGTRIEYRLAGADGTCPTSGDARYAVAPTGGGHTAFAVSGDSVQTGERTLCITVKPADKLRVSHGGKQLTVRTTLDGTADTWTTAGTWSAGYGMPASPAIDGLSCSAASWLDWEGEVRWNWANSEGLTVSRWEIQRQDGSSWVAVATVNDPDARKWMAGGGTYPWYFTTPHTYKLRVVAVLADGSTTVASAGTTSVRVPYALGIRLTVRCA